MNQSIPPEVAAWVSTHKGSRTPRHSPGTFADYSTSCSSDCWGQPIGGTVIPGGYRVAVCQPSPQCVGDAALFLYDFAKEAA